MSATESLINWDGARNLGKIPGSEWLCPTAEDLSSLGAVHRMSGSVTEDDIRIFADGRDQYYRLKQYPEGQYAVDIIDAETEGIRTGSRYEVMYKGLGSCSCGESFEGPTVVHRTFDESFPLPDGREIALVASLHGMTTVIKPTNGTGPEKTEIVPERRSFTMKKMGGVGPLDRATMWLTFNQTGGRVGAELQLSQLTGLDCEAWKTSSVTLKLNGSGQPTEVSINKKQLLDSLGVALKAGIYEEADGYTKIRDPAEIAKVTNGIATVLGMHNWTGIDLRRTAANIYASMGKPDFDMATSLVPRSPASA